VLFSAAAAGYLVMYGNIPFRKLLNENFYILSGQYLLICFPFFISLYPLIYSINFSAKKIYRIINHMLHFAASMTYILVFMILIIVCAVRAAPDAEREKQITDFFTLPDILPLSIPVLTAHDNNPKNSQKTITIRLFRGTANILYSAGQIPQLTAHTKLICLLILYFIYFTIITLIKYQLSVSSARVIIFNFTAIVILNSVCYYAIIQKSLRI